MADRDATDRAAYEATGNPLYVWFAIGRYGAGEPLPDWIMRYLHKSMRELARLMLDYTISPGEAQQQTARALGLVSQGRSAFADARHLREDSFLATLYGLMPGKGETESWVTDFAKKTGSRPRSIRRRVAKARRAWPK